MVHHATIFVGIAAVLAAIGGAGAADAAVMASPQPCRAEPAAAARVVTPLAAGATLQLLTLQGDWALVRAAGREPCWTPSRGVLQQAADVRAVTNYSAVTGPSGRVALDPVERASAPSDCPCGTGRSCKGPSGNRYCISRGVLTTRR